MMSAALSEKKFLNRLQGGDATKKSALAQDRLGLDDHQSLAPLPPPTKTARSKAADQNGATYDRRVSACFPAEFQAEEVN